MVDRPLILEEFIPYRLSITSNLVSDTIARSYAALFALSIPEWRLVAVVAETGGVTQQQISRRTRMDKVTVSRAAAGLVDRGVFRREMNPADKRSHVLRTTAAGEELYRAIAPKALDLEARLFASFSAAEIAQLLDMLARIDAVTLAAADTA